MRLESIFLLCLFLLTACGGGGGGGSDPIPPAPPAGPSAVNDQVSVDEDDSVLVDVTANDDRVDGSSLAIETTPSNGTAEIVGSEVRYIPQPDYAGSDSFRYSVLGDDGVTLTATVNVTVVNVNDAPVAYPDDFTIVEDNTLELTLSANDADVDSTIESYVIIGDPVGSISGTGTNLTYTPPLDFVGDISFTYRAVDAEGLESEEVNVTISVVPVTSTTLEVITLSIPQTGYATRNDAELNAEVFASQFETFSVPPNAISVLLSLSGADANINAGGLFISGLQRPSGLFPTYQRTVHFCLGGNCSGLIPKLPGYLAESGEWQYQVGTLSPDVSEIEFSGLSLKATVRTGPTPDLEASRPAAFRVQPYLTTTAITESDIQSVLERLVELAAVNSLEFVVEPVDMLLDTRFEIVSSSFMDSVTDEMVSIGAADTINVYFVEDFSDSEVLSGISGGIPGGLGFQNGYNGVMIDTGEFLFGGNLREQDMAEITFHEIGHLLGLYHTTEALFSNTDVLEDTPECIREIHDTNGNGTANTTECPDVTNPMFWDRSVLIEWEPLSEDQKHVLIHSPLAVPGTQ